MATKLSEITPSYHSFTNDQLLTAKQLNEFLSYFEDQDRLSRICLTGVGIICGFDVTYNNAAKTITLSQGVGLTTDGDLIELKKPKATNPPLPSNTDFDKVIQEIETAPKVYTHFKAFTDSNAKYAPFHKTINGAEVQLPLFELFTEAKADGTSQSLVNFGSSLSSMVVLIYLESFVDPSTACSGASCDNLGENQAQNLKVLLISPSDANYLIQNDPLYSRHFLFDTYETLPELALKRVVLSNSNTASIDTLKDAFRQVATDSTVLAALKTGLSSIYGRFGMNTQATNVQNKINQLFGFNSGNTPIDFQYRYDLLKDLMDSYQELKEQLLYLSIECSPNINSFPKHLLLGKLTEAKPYSTYRHQFYKSPALDIHLRVKRFMSLLSRVEEQLNAYALNTSVINTGTVRVTPSIYAAKLAEKSIPFYYSLNDELLKKWNFEKTAIFKQKTNLSYHTSLLSTDAHVQNPLGYNMEHFDFFRVEGYFSDTIDNTKNTLQQAITNYGLDFDVKVVEVKTTADSLNTLIQKHPSIEHKAGVTKGGTLLLVKNDNKLVADFALNYKIPAEAESTDSCCYYVACTYPWISSLKYINNLSRSLKGTQSRNKAMPSVYRFQVLEYSINGISLITTPVNISIPLNEIFIRRLHVVMEKLNTTFPTGLVFEFLEEIKQFKITKLERDTFKLVLRDTSLVSNGPIYTYTETGQLRNNNIFGNVSNTCQLIKMHHADTYRHLHQTYDPIGKDDDYGAFNEDWRAWGVLKRELKSHPLFTGNNFTMRFPTTWAHLKGDVQDELASIVNKIKDIGDADKNLTVDLYGDWPNGNWVNSQMLSYYNTHADQDGDSVVRFVKLRHKLHNKNGLSKYILHIKTRLDPTLFQTGLSDRLNKAEFYFQKPDAGNVIRVYPR